MEANSAFWIKVLDPEPFKTLVPNSPLEKKCFFSNQGNNIKEIINKDKK